MTRSRWFAPVLGPLLLAGCGDDAAATSPTATATGSAGATEEVVPTTSEDATADASASGEAAATADLTTTEPSATEPSATEPSATEPSATEPSATEPSAPSCSDGAHNGDETDLDCGGGCPACGDGAGCAVDADCASMLCVAGVCVASTCAVDDDCAALESACADGVCERGACVAAPTAEGAACDDLQVCTTGPAACVAGACVDVEGPVGQILLTDVAAGVGGFAIDPMSGHDYVGSNVALIPDFNGDGLADIAVGRNHNGYMRVWIVFGKADTARVSLVDVADGAGGLVISPQADDNLGAMVGGDFDGDGLGDLLVNSLVGNMFDRAYVVLGRPDPGDIALASVAGGAGGYVIEGPPQNGYWADDIANAGDVDGDGVDDLMFGMSGLDGDGPVNAGRTFIVFGAPGTAKRHFDDIAAGQGGFVIDGALASDESGLRVSGAGDVDGDGLGDVVVHLAAPFGAFRSMVVFGKQGGAKVLLADVEAGVGGFAVYPEEVASNEYLESRAAGDVNGDGLGDIVLGHYQYAGKQGRGYVVFGKQDTAPVHLGDVAAGAGGFVVTGFTGGDHGGKMVAPAGDLDGDGLADIVVSAPEAPTYKIGRTFAVFGKQDTAPVEVADLMMGAGGFLLEGEGNLAGFEGDGGLDVDGDGTPDILVGAPNFDGAIKDGGRAYVVFGGDCHP